MPLSRKELEKVAHLARLSLAPGDLDKFNAQIDAILRYVEKLNEMDLAKDLPPTAHVLDITDRFREDRVEKGLSPDEVAANAPDFRHGAIRVPRILEE